MKKKTSKKATVKLLKKAGTKALVAAGISKKFITSHVVFM
jgi:hypothetical protein